MSSWCFGLLLMYCTAAPAPLPAATAGATFCQVAKPIYWNGSDTRRTKEQADIHNRKGKALCAWGAATK